MKRRNVNQSDLLMALFNAMLKAYGKRNWWPAKTRFEVIVGAILTQNVSWRNVKTGILNLKKAGLLSPSAILKADNSIVAEKIRSTRFYNQKAVKLKGFCEYLSDKYDNSLNSLFSLSKSVDKLREELLLIHGIGKETADSIILYAGKKLSFVSDAYTKRFLNRYGLLKGNHSYDEIRNYFMQNLPQDLYIYNEFHALIVRHGNTICKTNPRCDICAIKTVNRNLSCDFATGRNNLILHKIPGNQEHTE